MANTISNMDDVIDPFDNIARIEYLTEEQENWAEEHPEADFMATEEGEELRVLLALQEEAEGYCSDWTYGAQLIRDSYFEDYAQELAEDCSICYSRTLCCAVLCCAVVWCYISIYYRYITKVLDIVIL